MIDGSIILPKLVASTMQSFPQRCRQKNAPVKCFLVAGLATGERFMPPLGGVPPDCSSDIFTALIAGEEPWVATTFDDESEPNAIYRSDTLFLPKGHVAVVRKLRKTGRVTLVMEFWSKPADSKMGYVWSRRDLTRHVRKLSEMREDREDDGHYGCDTLSPVRK